MVNLEYKPDIYEGRDPYICISCHQDDKNKILGILEKLDYRGFRFWLNDGIKPGMETDEMIAEHIEGCDYFVAFLSENYLQSLDMVDELNYSRDVNKEYLLVYLEDVVLPAGLDMRFMRAESIKAYAMEENAVYDSLLNIHDANRFYGIADGKLRGKAERIFAKLEQFYPEHKVFALDSVAHQVSKQISELYTEAGYPNAERLLLDYGFNLISNNKARGLRSSVLYEPGKEPEYIKSRIDYIMERLGSAYPNKMITDSLEKKHKAIYRSLQGISVWLGYENVAEMLTAYGFSGVSGVTGRTEIDHEAVIKELENRYEGKKKPVQVTRLMEENPDLKGSLKTLINRSNELFGMTFLQYLRTIGLIVAEEKAEGTTATAIKRAQIIEELKQCYELENHSYGTYEEAKEILGQFTLRKNVKGEIRISDCGTCGEVLKIPYGIHTIAKEAFAGHHELTTLILPPTLKEIGEAAFSGCSGLQTILFSEGLEKIDNLAFEGCAALTEIELPKGLRYVGNEAFFDCELLSEVKLGNPRTNIQEDAFDGCVFELENLQEENASDAAYFELKIDRKNNAKILAYTGDEEIVVVPGSIGGHPILSIEKGCFKGNLSVKEIYISDQITTISGDVFKDCKNLEKVHLSEAVKNLTATAFSGCTSLSEVNIPDQMTEVQRGLFKDSPLTTLYVGKNTERISGDAFYKGEVDVVTGIYLKKKALENIIVDTGNQSFRAEGSMLLSKDGKILLAELGDPVKAVIPEGVEEISAMAYDKQSLLTEVVFPNTLKKIGEKAFAGTGLKFVEFPDSLEVIDTQAFSFCRKLEGAELNEGLRVIAVQAFEGCPIQDVYVPKTVESIGNNSFLAISTYQGEIVQNFRVDTANEHLIADGIALYMKTEEGMTLVKAYNYGLRVKPNEEAGDPTEYSILEGTTCIAEHAFARCNHLKSVEIPEGVVSIGDMAFWDCSKLTEIHLPESCTEVSPKAFLGININII